MAIVAQLEDQPRQGAKRLVGNRGYRKYLPETRRGAFEIDQKKVKDEARFDGKCVVQIDTELSAEDVALKYKELLMVEELFRSLKSILETRPIYHKCDNNIRGHVFCSFLALLLMKELQARISARAWQVEWRRMLDDLDDLQEVTICASGKTFVVRTPTPGDAGKAIQAAGVGLGSTVRLR